MKRLTIALFILACCVIAYSAEVNIRLQDITWSGSGTEMYGRFVATGITPPPFSGWTDPDTYWFLQEFETTNTTQFLDTSGKGTHATWITQRQYIVGTNQFARVEHGVNLPAEYLVTTNWVPPSYTTMTVTCWIWLNDIISNEGLFSQWIAGGGNGNWFIYLGQNAGNGKLEGYINESDNTPIITPASGVIPASTWLHVAMVADGSKVRLYTNMVECGTGTSYDGTLRQTATPIYIGALSVGVYVQQGGFIDGCTYAPYARSLANLSNEFYYTHPTNNVRIRQ